MPDSPVPNEIVANTTFEINMPLQRDSYFQLMYNNMRVFYGEAITTNTINFTSNGIWSGGVVNNTTPEVRALFNADDITESEICHATLNTGAGIYTLPDGRKIAKELYQIICEKYGFGVITNSGQYISYNQLICARQNPISPEYILQDGKRLLPEKWKEYVARCQLHQITSKEKIENVDCTIFPEMILCYCGRKKCFDIYYKANPAPIEKDWIENLEQAVLF